MQKASITAVLDFLGDRATLLRQGAADTVMGPAPVTPGEAGAVSFCTTRTEAMGETVRASASSFVLVSSGVSASLDGASAWVVAVDDPRTTYVQVLNAFFSQQRATGIHPSAVISTRAELGDDVYVGPQASIGDATIGHRCVIGAGVVILDGVTIGDDVTIGPNTTIGFTGFGYARDDAGMPVPFPHYGGVRIGDRVEIGANTAVDRGALSDTVIEDDAKIDNLVHVAHNCHIKKGAFVIAHTILCGSVVVGERAWVAPNASVLEHVVIGDDATVGLAATVIRDVDPGSVVVGSPARPIAPRTSN